MGQSLEINPNSVMVELAQTGSGSNEKFFDVVSESQESSMPQTQEDNMNGNVTGNATAPKKDTSKPKRTLDEELLYDPEKVNEEDHHFHGVEYV